MGSEKIGTKLAYFPVCTREEHIHNWTVEMCESSFDNSIGKLIAAYAGGEKLSKEAADELREYLRQYE